MSDEFLRREFVSYVLSSGTGEIGFESDVEPVEEGFEESWTERSNSY